MLCGNGSLVVYSRVHIILTKDIPSIVLHAYGLILSLLLQPYFLARPTAVYHSHIHWELEEDLQGCTFCSSRNQSLLA